MQSSPSASAWCVPLDTRLSGERPSTWLSPHNEVGRNIKIYGPGKVNGSGEVTREAQVFPGTKLTGGKLQNG
ncbi:hypothetical protein ACRRTK_011798 [Alexandromys fortis]